MLKSHNARIHTLKIVIAAETVMIMMIEMALFYNFSINFTILDGAISKENPSL